MAALAAFSLVCTACSDDGTGSNGRAVSEATSSTTIPTPSTVPSTAQPTTPPVKSPLDFNADGQVVFGVATTGPASGGGWSQNIADATKDLSAENGFAEPIVVDNILPNDAATLISELAQQPVDVIVIGAASLAVPLTELIAQHPDIYWYCNCGAGIPQIAGLTQVTDDGAEIGYTAGYAVGLLLDARNERRITVIGCCDLAFEKQVFNSLEDGLQDVDPSFRMTYVRTGEPGYDFNNIVNATDAFQTAVDERTHAVFPYVDGAHRAVAQAANVAGKILLSAGSSTACADGEIGYDIAVSFDGGDYLRAVLPYIIDGTLPAGSARSFKVGIDPGSGAFICNATPEQQAAMDALYVRIAAGELDAQFALVTEKAFADEINLSQDLLN